MDKHLQPCPPAKVGKTQTNKPKNLFKWKEEDTCIENNVYDACGEPQKKIKHWALSCPTKCVCFILKMQQKVGSFQS